MKKPVWPKTVKNIPEDEVLSTIDRVANRLAYKFLFGYHDVEDIKQQARLFAWEGLSSYDGIRKLENFLWTHVKNRLCNYKRDNYERPDNPCLKCEGCPYDDRDECDKLRSWTKRNTPKKNLMSTTELSEDSSVGHNPNIISTLQTHEMDYLINLHLPIRFRQDYLRLKLGLRLIKIKRLRVQEEIRKIVGEYDE